MRTSRIPGVLTALLCGAALSISACGGEGNEPRSARLEPAAEEMSPLRPEAPESLPPAPSADADPEIRAERSVEASEQVAAAERQDLESTQRELDRREAELTARARRLRELERRERALKTAEREIERREAEVAERPAPAPPREPAAEVAPEPDEPGMAAAELDPVEEPEPERDEEARPEPAAPMTVDAGTVFAVEFLETLSSASSRPGETFRARVTRDIRQDGRIAIPAGSEVVGEVTEAVPLRKVGGRAKLAVRFTDLVLPTGTSAPIEASFVEQGRSETGRDAATIGGAAAGGAVLGRVLNKGDRSKGAVIGAILGAVIGTAVASRTPGEEVTIPEGALVDLKLDEAVEIRPRR